MNLKKSLVSVAAGLAMVGSLIAPAIANTVDGTYETYEAGTFSYGLNTSQKPNFGVSGVDTFTPDQVLTADQNVNYHEFRSSSPGWSLQLSATDFVANDGSGHKIAKNNLRVSSGNFFPSGSNRPTCLTPAANKLTPNSDNPFGALTVLLTSKSDLSSNVALSQMGEGRGCGYFYQKLTWELTVPEGSHTGGATADDPLVYESNITISTVAAPGS